MNEWMNKWMNGWMSDTGVCKTSPATLGLLKKHRVKQLNGLKINI